jgi:hypothetical protein
MGRFSMKTFSFGFYDFIPEKLENNHLYISMKYRSIIHLCPCGCGNKVVTTLSPARWKLIFDGETVSSVPGRIVTFSTKTGISSH